MMLADLPDVDSGAEILGGFWAIIGWGGGEVRGELGRGRLFVSGI